jgi:hypothetical protein
VEPISQGTISLSLKSIIERLKLSTGNYEIAGILERVGVLMDFISHKTCDDELWKSSARAASMLTPISHSLLSIPRVMENVNDYMYMDHLPELTRVALLIILARLQQAFSFPSDELLFLQERFRHLLLRHSGSELPDLELWCVTYVALIDQVHMRAYIRQIDDLAGTLGIWGSENTLKTVRNIIFVDQVLSLDTDVFVFSLDTTHRSPELDLV